MTIAANPAVDVTLAATNAAAVMHAGHISFPSGDLVDDTNQLVGM